MFKQMMAACAVVFVAGAAQAVPSIELVEEEWGILTDVDAGFDQGPPRTGIMDQFSVLGTPGAFGGSFEIAPGDLGPDVNEVRSSQAVNSSFSGQGFSVMSSATAVVDMENPLDFGDPFVFENYSEARTAVNGSFTVNLTEDALVRISVTGSLDTTIGDLDFQHFVSFSGPSLATTSVGLGDEATAAPPLMFEAELLAGEYSFQFINDFTEGRNDNFPEGFTYFADLGLSFEIIPAPGATALFSLGGMVAARRRR